MIKKTTCTAVILIASPLLVSKDSQAQTSAIGRHMERIDRGAVAVLQDNGNVFISWRWLGTDPNNIAWQNVAYNQPPHLSFYLGHSMPTPPRPNIVVTGDSY